jgi:hypothetical protein
MAGDGRRGQPEPRTELEYRLRQMDQTWPEIIKTYHSIAANLGEDSTMTERHFRRLATGERSGTTPGTRRVLHAMFGQPMATLLRPFTSRVAEPAVVGPLDSTIVAAPGTEKEMLEMAAQRARKFALVAGQNTLTDETIEQVYDDVRQLARDYPRKPLTNLLPPLVDVQDTVFSLLERTNRPAHTRQLYFLAGVAGGLLAKASHDLADPHDALTQARTAYVCADNADHAGLRPWIRGVQSMIAYWAGRPQEAARYAKSGADYARNTAAVWLPISEARAWAALGDADRARAAIHRAETAWDTVQPDELDELGGICTFGRVRQLYYAADALIWLPSEAESAEHYARQAVTAYADTSNPEWAFGDQAGSQADLAIAHISGRELDGAGAAARPLLNLPPEQRINGVVVSARRVRDALARSPLATDSREMQDEIEVFTRTPVAAIGR